MATNRFYKSAPVDFQFEETPLQPLMLSLQARQQRYDTSYALGEELRNKKIQGLQQDQARANALTSQWQQRIDEAVNAADGDYSSAYKDIRALTNEVNKAYNPGGEANAIQTNYQNFINAQEEERKRLTKGEITSDQFANWKTYELSNYAGVGEKDPITDSYNQFNPEGIAEYVDTYKLGLEAVKELEPEAQNIKYDEVKGGWIYTKNNKIESLEPERIQQAVYDRLSNDNKTTAYFDQFYKHQGIDPSTGITDAAIALQAQSFAPYAYRKITDEQSIKANPWAMLQATEAGKNARAEARLRQNQNLFGQEHNFKTRIDLAEESGVAGQEVNLETLLEDDHALGAAGGFGSKGGLGTYGYIEEPISGDPEVAKKDRLKELVRTGGWAKIKGGNNSLMEKILDDNPDISADEAVKKHNSAITTWKVQSPSALELEPAQSEEIGKRLFKYGDLFRGPVRVKKEGTTSYEEVPGDAFQEDYKRYIFIDGNPDKGLKPGVGVTTIDRLTGEYNVNVPGLQVKKGGSYSQQMEPAAHLASALQKPNFEPTEPIQIDGLYDYGTPVVRMVEDPNTGDLVPIQVPKDYSNHLIRSRGEAVKNEKTGEYELKVVIESQAKSSPWKDHWEPLKFGGENADINTIVHLLESDQNNGLVPNFGKRTTSDKQVVKSYFGNDQITEE